MNGFWQRLGQRLLGGRYWVLVGLAGVAAIALTACNPRELKTQAAQVPQLVTSVLGDPKTFNYAVNNSFPNIFSLTFEGLVDEHGITAEIIPALAESWKISDDKLKFVFTLRPNLQWSDGQPLTADDVVFSYNDVYLNEAIPTDVRDGLRIGTQRALPKVRKLDDRHVEFTLPEPFAPFLRNMTIKILPAHILRSTVQKKDADGKPQFISTWGTDTDPTKIVTNGPYVMESYTPSQRLVYRRNPHYWRQDAQDQQRPQIQRLIWQIVENSDVRMLRFRSGDLDMAGLRPEDFSLLHREQKRGKFDILNGGPASGTTFMAFNLNKALNDKGQPFVDPIKSQWFNNQAFRQAIAYALDRRSLINNLYRGIGDLQNSPISVQSPYFLPPEQGLKVYAYDPKKAKELLLAAGFKYTDKDQLMDAAGHPVKFRLLLPAGSKTSQQFGSQIQQDLKKIGIQVDLDPVDFNVLVEKVDARNWETYFLSYSGSVEPNDGANYWASNGTSHDFNQGQKAGTPKISGWTVSDWEKEIDRLFVTGAQEFDEAKRKRIYAQFQQIVQERVPVIHFVNPYAITAVRHKVKGVQFSGLDSRGVLWNVYDLKVQDN